MKKNKLKDYSMYVSISLDFPMTFRLPEDYSKELLNALVEKQIEKHEFVFPRDFIITDVNVEPDGN